jgi:chromosome segregation and condensation protein ScpB
MERIHEMLGPDFELNLFQEAMTALMDRYQSTAHGIEIVQVANGYQFRTKAGRAAREIEQMIPASQSQNPEDEDPRVKEMRKLVGQMKADTSVSLIYDAREDEKILKDIKERVGSIATTTPYLEQQKEIEKQTAEAAKHGMTLEEWGAAQAAAAAAKEAEKAAKLAGESAPESGEGESSAGASTEMMPPPSEATADQASAETPSQ